MGASKTPTIALRWPCIGQLVSASIGVLTSLYLLIQHTRLNSGIQGASSFCALGKLADCDLVNTSLYSEIFGLPLAGIGAVYYFILLLLALLTTSQNSSFSHFQQAIAWLCLLGLFFDSILLSIQIFTIMSICVLCLLTYLANAAILLFCFPQYPKAQLSFGKTLKTLLFQKGGLPELQVPLLILVLLSLVSFLGVVILLPNHIRLNSNTYSMVNDAIEQFYLSWKNRKTGSIDWKDGDGTFGNPDAPVQVVEFSDFQCPHCHKAAFTLHAALKPLSDRIFFVFKNFPLDSECNSSVSYRLHENACSLARFAYCAKKKGRFWDFHDRIFFNSLSEDLKPELDFYSNLLSGILTKEEIRECLNSRESLNNVLEDIKIGQELDIKGTPSIFINGKQITIPLTIGGIRKLVDIELSLKKK